MLISIRRGVFETNSSSVHSLSLCSEDEFDRWKKNEVFYVEGKGFETLEEIEIEKTTELSRWSDFAGDFSSLSDAIQQFRNGEMDEWKLYEILGEEDIYSYEYFFEEYNSFEKFIEHHKVDNKEIVAFGYYGFD